jgi:hypothetical protein
MSSSESESARACLAASSAAEATSFGTFECFGFLAETQDNSNSNPLSKTCVKFFENLENQLSSKFGLALN